MTRWAFVVADTDGTPLAELTEARARRLTVRLDAGGDAGFSIDGRHEQAETLTELATDLLVYRNDDLVYRGRIGQTQDQAAADRHTVAVESADYRALLGRRVLYADQSFAATEQEAVGWALIAYTQGLRGGDMGITRRPAQATGVVRDKTWTAGKNIGEALTQLGHLINGFEWDISPELEYRVWTERGADNGVVLDYGGLLTGFSRTVNPSAFANAVRVTGDDTLTAEARDAADIATAASGRFDAQHGYPDITVQATLAARADWHLAEGRTIRPSWSVTMKAGAWNGPDHLWLGDTVLLAVKSGRVNAVEAVRVHALDVGVDDDGAETVQLTLGRPPMKLDDHLRRITQRVVDLERR